MLWKKTTITVVNLKNWNCWKVCVGWFGNFQLMQNASINTGKIIFIYGIACTKHAANSLRSITARHLEHDTWFNWRMLRLSIKFYKLNEQFLQLTQCQSWILLVLKGPVDYALLLIFLKRKKIRTSGLFII